MTSVENKNHQDTVAKAELLRTLYRAPEIVRVVNVWDAASTKVVSDLPQTKAIATAGHSIAAMYGYAYGGMPL
jgi:2-methylisocitrate lyase-like PEP mutase family enzyme